MSSAARQPDSAVFERHRARLFGIAYRMLGSVADAEDVVQESYLRWHTTDPVAVRNAEAWLVAVTTRIAIDRLRRLTTEREAYLGTWLPEPIAGGASIPADRHAELVSDLSMAFLVMLERLAPEERAAFLLREVFEVGYQEIAGVLDRSEAACRQLVHRARERVRGDRARFSVPAETRERLLERLLSALERGDRQELLALVAPDATWDSDGGGKVSATRRTVKGADRIVRMLLGFERKGRGLVRHSVAWVNGEPAIITHAGDRLLFTTSVATDGELLLAFYRVLNPDKLTRLALSPDGSGSGEDA